MAEAASPLRIVVAWSSEPGVVCEKTLLLAPGSTLAEALEAASIASNHSQACGVWGREVDRNHILRDGDRVEVYRDLTVDPKVARRERFARQGARAAGLFAQQRSASKAGG